MHAAFGQEGEEGEEGEEEGEEKQDNPRNNRYLDTNKHAVGEEGDHTQIISKVNTTI